jgi:Cu2+-containing amine oxidase
MGISQTSQQPNPEDDMKRVTSPWDSLSANEIEQAARAIRARHGDATIFNRISLSQPEKVSPYNGKQVKHPVDLL